MTYKNVTLKTGASVRLYLNETSGQYTLDEEEAKQSISNFRKCIIEENEEICGRKYRTSILEYYNCSSKIVQQKIEEMINKDIKKLELVYNIVLESIINKKRAL